MPTIKNYQEKDKKAEYAYKFYLNKGYTPAQSSAIVGNLLRESSLNPNAIGDGGKAFGLAQWHPDRQAKAKQLYGDKWKDFDNQLDFVDWELNNTEKEAGNALKNSKGVWNAGQIITDKFERPKVRFNADEERQKHVADVYRKYGKLDLSPEDKKMFEVSFEKDVAPYMNNTTSVTNFDIPIDNTNFASVPDIPQKEETKTEEALNTLKEKEFVEQYKSFFTEQKAPEQQEQTHQPIQPTDVQGIFDEVSQFVEAQQGGTVQETQAPQIPIRNILYGVETVVEKQGLPPSKGLIRVDYENGKSDYLRPSGLETLKSMNNYRIYMENLSKNQNSVASFQQGGIPISSRGVFASGDKPVVVPSPNISMKGVPYNIEAISLETGEKKTLLPNMEYFFKNTKNVLEIPKIK